MTLTDFLLARLDEVEADALAATPGPWNASDLTDVGTIWNAVHIARNDPAHVLADVASKRAVLARAVLLTEDSALDDIGWEIMGNLASPHVDHPDYDESWKP